MVTPQPFDPAESDCTVLQFVFGRTSLDLSLQAKNFRICSLDNYKSHKAIDLRWSANPMMKWVKLSEDALTTWRVL